MLPTKSTALGIAVLLPLTMAVQGAQFTKNQHSGHSRGKGHSQGHRGGKTAGDSWEGM